MSSLKTEENVTGKSRRIPNAFLIFVKEQRASLLQNCPVGDRNEIAAFIGRKWRSMSPEEKQVYYDKYKVLKETKTDKSDLNSDNEDKLTEDGELSMENYTVEESVVADSETSKTSNKPTADDLVDGVIKKCDPNSPTKSDIDYLSIKKLKPLKKSRRPPNAFMLFANERRSSLDTTSSGKDKKCHVNAVLGNMWRELPNSEKTKYLSEARQLLALHKKSDTTSSNKIPKKTKKVRFKVPKKFSRQSSQEKKERLPKSDATLPRVEANDIKKLEAESKPNKAIVDKIESPENASSESHATNNDCSSSSSQSQATISKSHPQRTTPSTEESHHSNHCCCRPTLSPHCSNNDSFKHYSASDVGISRSCFGAGFLPPMLPPCPFNVPFSMYQQAMTHPMFPFPSMGFPPSPSLCGCSSPYFYNSTYFNAYSSLYSGRMMTPFSYGSHSSSSTTANSTSTREEAAEATKNDDSPDDEVLVVDETSDGQGNESSD